MSDPRWQQASLEYQSDAYHLRKLAIAAAAYKLCASILPNRSKDDAHKTWLVTSDFRVLGDERIACAILTFDAKVAVTENDPERFLTDITSACRIIRHMSEIPTTIATVSASTSAESVSNILLTAIEQELVLNARQLNELREALHMISLQPAMLEALDGEYAMFLDMLQECYITTSKGDGTMPRIGIEQFERITSDSPTEESQLAGKEHMGSRQSEIEFASQYIHESKLAATVPPYAWPKLGLDKIDHRHEHNVKAVPFQAPLSGVLFPSLQRIVLKHWQATQMLNAADTMLAVEQFKLATNSTPIELSVLVPAFMDDVPRDIYSDGYLLWQETDAIGWTLSSAGPTGEDTQILYPPSRR
ncbi:MAG: hypothetical protein H6815_12580 [Phycisphaeraceae bacterium]|nr:hypothetical protein [Phycisphaerales bacterium]MCB9861277.1 hypothetical protein [Phycisphaeraceae bacterium]